MPIDIDKIWVFRILPIQNLEYILSDGLHCKNSGKKDKGFVTIGSKEIITQRDTRIVKCYPGTVVNDYVPFYFSVRTPMLFNIISGHGVPASPQKDIIYLCCKLSELATDDFQWCYTNGNAATAISKFYKELDDIENNVDWRSIRTTDFRDENADGDEDRIRKKHAEFLVKDKVPVDYIKVIAVLNQTIKEQVEAILEDFDLTIDIIIKPEFYF
ncbi:MAG: DUF4433 domain-containing protein [Saprospiraceae bacterium]|nr:DUF4433 domain-containing protein [Saprospiraceae bacterium]HMX88318.1 DUF4433 domain-containing protein [Saprospiraceae bacterium]HMZ40398.1 DUF4433 domain-containing protein [Saprospiraceae bacterium]HNB30271.1 DUF4433 domain-containing protein [Saprospiraceae bacterium]HNC35636.1 DUF4433 domain-containing protein [Saprospiraceae bacterium]